MYYVTRKIRTEHRVKSSGPDLRLWPLSDHVAVRGTPEQKLCAAIILRAVQDARGAGMRAQNCGRWSRGRRKEAHKDVLNWLLDTDSQDLFSFNYCADAIGLSSKDASAIRAKASEWHHLYIVLGQPVPKYTRIANKAVVDW